MNSRRYKKASSRIARREKTRKTLSLFLKIAVPVAVLVGLIFLSRASFLQVKNFQITGGESLSEQDIKNSALNLATGTEFLVIPKSNILFLSKSKLAAALLSQFGRVSEVDINKNLFNGIVKIAVKERSSDYLWCSETNECFFMDKTGLVFEKSVLDGGLIVFKGKLTRDPVMKNFATPEEMQNYIKLIGALKNGNAEVESINIESADKGIAATNLGDIVFDPKESDLTGAAQNATLLINEIKAKTPGVKFEYIDTRFGNKLFYKIK